MKWFDEEVRTPKHYREKRVSALRLISETLFLILIALVCSSLVKTYFFQAFEIPTGSMEKTLNVGDRIVVSKLYPTYRNINRGDIVVFRDSQKWLGERYKTNPNFFSKALIFIGLLPDNAQEHLVKRIIGLPGDHIVGEPGKGISVNGVKIDEKSYIYPGVEPTEIAFNLIVPKDKIWVMGDNRSHSEDSRFHQDTPGKGFVPISDITGVAVIKVWPFSSFEFFSAVNSFDAVKPAK